MYKKIAFSGPSGLGKTTLCKEVTKRFKVPHLSTSAMDVLDEVILDEMSAAFGYEGGGHRAVINLSSTNPEFGKFFQDSLLWARAHQISQNESFVIDRCPIDNVAYMLAQVSHNADPEWIDRFIKEAQAAYAELEAVIMINYSPDIPSIEDNNSRIANPYFQEYMSYVFSYVYGKYFAHIKSVRILTIDFWDWSERVRLVDNFLGNGKED